MKVFTLGGYGIVGLPAIRLLAGYDIIMNSSTDEAVLPTMQAAIHTGTHYCDVE